MKNIFTITLVLFCFILNGQIITDRPDQTESSSTVGNGNLQIESGFLIQFDGDRLIPSRQILAPTSLFRYGITEGIELRLLSQFESLQVDGKTIKGISDLELGTKIQLLRDESKNIEIAFLSHLIMPTGTKTLSLDDYGTINKLSIAHDINENSSIGYNLGYNYFGSGKGDFTYSFALGIAVNEKVGIYIEPYGDLVDFEDLVLNFDAGVTYLIHDNLQLDFSFGTGITDNMNYISVGGSWLLLQKNN